MAVEGKSGERKFIMILLGGAVLVLVVILGVLTVGRGLFSAGSRRLSGRGSRRTRSSARRRTSIPG